MKALYLQSLWTQLARSLPPGRIIELSTGVKPVMPPLAHVIAMMPSEEKHQLGLFFAHLVKKASIQARKGEHELALPHLHKAAFLLE